MLTTFKQTQNTVNIGRIITAILKNREKFLAYSQEYYSVKKLLASYPSEEQKEKKRDQKEREKVIKREEKVLNNFFLSHTLRTLTIARKNKEQGGVKPACI